MIDSITLTGGLVADPEIRFTPSGAAVASFRIAQSDSKKDEQGNWVKTNSLYLACAIWNDNPEWKKDPIPWAEMAATLTKGDRIAVHGKLVTRTWEAKDGSNRSQIELQADSFFTIPHTSQAPAGGGFQQTPPNPAPQHQGATWGQATPTGQQATTDEPPF